ncbi:MAG: hypothetical protein HRU21_00820 [Pseudomonadales bacterium]|nr:hypothetical protein [Pseudomonadales bacterium]
MLRLSRYHQPLLALALLLLLLSAQALAMHHELEHADGHHDVGCELLLHFDSQTLPLSHALHIIAVFPPISPDDSALASSNTSFPRYGLSRAPPLLV